MASRRLTLEKRIVYIPSKTGAKRVPWVKDMVKWKQCDQQTVDKYTEPINRLVTRATEVKIIY